MVSAPLALYVLRIPDIAQLAKGDSGVRSNSDRRHGSNSCSRTAQSVPSFHSIPCFNPGDVSSAPESLPPNGLPPRPCVPPIRLQCRTTQHPPARTPCTPTSHRSHPSVRAVAAPVHAIRAPSSSVPSSLPLRLEISQRTVQATSRLQPFPSRQRIPNTHRSDNAQPLALTHTCPPTAYHLHLRAPERGRGPPAALHRCSRTARDRPWDAGHGLLDQRLYALHLGDPLPDLFVPSAAGTRRFSSALHAAAHPEGAFDHASVHHANLPQRPAVVCCQPSAVPGQGHILGNRSQRLGDSATELSNRRSSRNAHPEHAAAAVQSHRYDKCAAGPGGWIHVRTAAGVPARFEPSEHHTGSNAYAINRQTRQQQDCRLTFPLASRHRRRGGTKAETRRRQRP